MSALNSYSTSPQETSFLPHADAQPQVKNTTLGKCDVFFPSTDFI